MCNLGQRHLRESTQLVIGGGFKDGERCVAITRDSCVDVEDLKSNQEEEDTRMLLHAKYAAGQCQEAKIVIQSPDTDLLVLSAAHFEDIASKELWFRTGVKDRLRFVPVHDVCLNLSNRVLKALPAFHALIGCDTTSALSGIGKKKPRNVFIRSAVHQESFTILGQQPEVDEETAKKCEAFICDLYPSYKKSQKKPNSEALPPTSDSLRQHINRTNYQTHIWRKSLTRAPISRMTRVAKRRWWADARADVQGPVTYQPIGAYYVYLQEERVHQQLFLCKCRSLVYRSLYMYGGGHVQEPTWSGMGAGGQWFRWRGVNMYRTCTAVVYLALERDVGVLFEV